MNITTLDTILRCVLQEYRKVNRWSTKYAASLSGISQSTYWKIENGTLPLTTQRVYGIAALLNLKPSVLLDQQEKLAALLKSKGWTIEHEYKLRDGLSDCLQVLMDTNNVVGFTSVKTEYESIRLPSAIAQAIGEVSDMSPHVGKFSLVATEASECSKSYILAA